MVRKKLSTAGSQGISVAGVEVGLTFSICLLSIKRCAVGPP